MIPKFSEKKNIFLISVIAISFLGLASQQAFAASPTITAYVGNDPDDGDNVFGAGDTLTITTNIPTNATIGTVTNAAFVTGNFTFALPDPLAGLAFNTDWTAEWTDAQNLVITFININNVPVVGTSTVDVSGGNTIGDQTADDAGMTNGAPDILTGDFGLFVSLNSGGDCSGDCESPTLGVDSKQRRLVDNGFTYNGKPVNVERYFTPYPLITVDVGVQNLAEFKIYDNWGPDNISHFDLAFGLAQGEILSQSKVMIEWDKTFDGKQSINIIDPDNVLDNVKVITSEGKCKESSKTDDCLIVKVYHTFRAPPEFNIVGTNVWDSKRNGWQNYYNHGIEVVGESMNPPKQHVGIDNGNLVTITEIDKNLAIDDDGNYWTFDKTWIKEYVPNGKIVDSISSQGYDRNHAYFETYMKGQELLAIQKQDQSLDKNETPFKSLKKPFSYYFDFISRADDDNLQQRIAQEIVKSEKLYDYLYEYLHPYDYH